MKLKSLVLSNILLAGSLLALPVIAADDQYQADNNVPSVREQLAYHHPGCGQMGHHEGFVKALGITDDQLERFAELKNQYNLASASKKAELKSLHWKMHELMTEPNLDRQQITSLNDKINALRTDLSNTRLSYSMDRASVLTPEQRKQIRHFMLEHQMMHGHGSHHGHHGFQHHGE